MTHIYRGPWQWISGDRFGGSWAVPWSIGAIDLRSIPEQSQQGGVPGLGIFMADKPIADSNYDLIGIGNWHDIKPTQVVKDSIPKPKKYTLEGDDLVGILFNLLTNGADPTGQSFAKPLVPGTGGRIDLSLGNRQYSERFSWGNSRTAKVRDTLRLDFQQIFDDAKAGKLNDAEHHRRVLDAMCEKYQVVDFKEFVPTAIQKDVPGTLPHKTTITDTFNRADADALGASSEGWSWTETSNDIDIVSNAAEGQSVGYARARAESDLSSADNYAQISVSALGSGVAADANCRMALSNNTFYWVEVYTTTNTLYLIKTVVGATTVLSSTAVTISIPEDYKVSASGSTIKAYKAGTERLSATDSAISGNLRTGIQTYRDGAGSSKPSYDAFQAGDFSASGFLFTQLERETRGVMRGVYTRY